MFKKVLVANRGEIALRIIRALRELGIRSVAIYSQADVNSLHVHCADEAICIGPPASSESYLNISQIISAALVTGCDAIHPGCGFLSENAKFAEICQAHLIEFIGPSPEVIRKMGDKAQARLIAKRAGVTIIPGTSNLITSLSEAEKVVKKIGYPVILKASAGGGGKGMRIVMSPDEMGRAIDLASAEAKSAFGDSALYLEKYLLEPRHIEVQILGDKYGNIIHLNERECSIQFRHQKLIEESPSPGIDARLRQKITEAAIKIAKAVKYSSLGTIEFLVDNKKNFYFMEMNTRIQVEHPITEVRCGLDIAKEQIMVADGKRLNYSQKDINLWGWALECRVNAQDANNGFMPVPGKVTNLNLPGGPGVRVDTHLYTNYSVPPHYDPLLAKIITFGQTRNEAIDRMNRALDELVVEGIKTTIPFHKKVLNDDSFKKGKIHTDFLSYIIGKEEEKKWKKKA